MSAGALGALAFLDMEDLAAIIPLVLALSVIEGVSALNWIAVGDYFGRQSFATLAGIMTVFYSFGALVPPVASS